MKARWLPPVMVNNAASAPPVIVKVDGLVPTVSASVVARSTTAVVFSATLGVAVDVNTGALSFTSVTAIVNVCAM